MNRGRRPPYRVGLSVLTASQVTTATYRSEVNSSAITATGDVLLLRTIAQRSFQRRELIRQLSQSNILGPRG